MAASGILAVQAGRGGNDQDVTFSSLQSGTALVTRKNHHSGSGSKRVSQFVQLLILKLFIDSCLYQSLIKTNRLQFYTTEVMKNSDKNGFTVILSVCGILQIQWTISDFDMGAKHSRLSEEDFRFLEEETAMSKATLEVSIVLNDVWKA